MASPMPEIRPITDAAPQSVDAQAGADVKKYPHTFQSGSTFVLGVAAIVFGLAGAVASCALLPFAPVAALPVAITCVAVVATGFHLLKQANLDRLEAHGLSNPHPNPRLPRSHALRRG